MREHSIPLDIRSTLSVITPGTRCIITAVSVMPERTFTAVVHKEDDLFVAECPEVGTVSQGYTLEEAVANLKEATDLYLEEFPPIEPTR